MNTLLEAPVFLQATTDVCRRSETRVMADRAAFWRINGYRVKLLMWTTDEWEQLESPPSDAQLHPAGVWCALRLD
jgi:hypothetical protein